MSFDFSFQYFVWVYVSLTITATHLYRLSLNWELTYLVQSWSDVCVWDLLFPSRFKRRPFCGGFRSYGQTSWRPILLKFGFFNIFIKPEKPDFYFNERSLLLSEILLSGFRKTWVGNPWFSIKLTIFNINLVNKSFGDLFAQNLASKVLTR